MKRTLRNCLCCIHLGLPLVTSESLLYCDNLAVVEIWSKGSTSVTDIMALITTRHTYQTGVKAPKQFCKTFNIVPFLMSALTLHYFCYSLAQRVSHNTIKVYLAGIPLEHIERSLPDPTQDELLRLLCTGIKRSLANKRRTRLPITISILCLLKIQLRQQTSFSLLEEYVLWAAFALAFYGFLRASEFATNDLTWSGY